MVADTIKPTSAEAVARLCGMGLRLVLLTGDDERAARSVADAVGIGEVIARVLPVGKAAAVRQLQGAGRMVAMAGDGGNDAAPLAQSDLRLAMGTGTGTAPRSRRPGRILVCGDPLAVPDAPLLSRRTLATIKGNRLQVSCRHSSARRTGIPASSSKIARPTGASTAAVTVLPTTVAWSSGGSASRPKASVRPSSCCRPLEPPGDHR